MGKFETKIAIRRIESREAAALLFGLLIRETFSFWTGHPSDFELWVRLGYAMNHGGNPYGVLPPVPGLSFANIFSANNAATVAYLPFWPLATGLIFAVYSLSGLDNRFAYYFLLKQPEIIGDVALAYLLYSYVKGRKPHESIWVLLLWLFSPFSIIISGMWGMFDSLAMALILISMMSNGYVKNGLCTGLSIFAKSVPVIYAVPTTIRQRHGSVGLLIAVGIPALFSIATFLLMSWPISTAGATLLSTVGKGGESMSVWDSFFYLNYLGILSPLPPNVFGILGLLWIPAIIVLTVVSFRRFDLRTDHGRFQSLLVATLAFLIFKARVTEQYAIYLFALAAVDVAVWHPERKRMLLLMMGAVLVYLLSNNYLLTRFLAPVYPNFIQIETGVNESFGLFRYTVNFLSGTIFTILNVKYLITMIKRKVT